jgi:hypothetical protein
MANGIGNVYVFNLYVQNVTSFTVNGQASAGTIVAPSQTTKALYVPQQLVVPRTPYPKQDVNSSLFAQGENDFTVDFPYQNWTGSLTIDTTWPALNFDLWLYVTFQAAWLLDTFGHFQPIYSQKTTVMKGDQQIVTYNYQPPPNIIYLPPTKRKITP